jgi:2-methylcitrate dehydratase PrpD
VSTDPSMTPAWQRWQPQIDSLRDAVAVRQRRALPEEVSRHGRLVVLDTLGCALAGRSAPQVAALETSLAALEPGGFRFPRGAGLGLRAATQLLAIGPTWNEACEGHAFAHGRPGIATLAALLPLALQRDATLGQSLAAFVAGYEVGARAGGWLRVAPGIHVDGNWPALAAAAGTAQLLGLGVEQTMRAVAIAACQLPASLYLPIRTGRNVRNLYLAHSATLGLDAALAAQAGIDAPPDALGYYAEHWCRAVAETPPPADADLILDAYLKPFAAVRHVQYGALTARRLRARLGGDTSHVKAIVLTVYQEAATYCSNPAPRTPLAAQFSLSFGVAAMLRFGALDAASYAPPNFDDAELRRLEALVEVRIDPDLTATGQRGATLSIATDTGALEASTGPREEPELLLDAAGAVAKFIQGASACVSAPDGRAFSEVWLSAAPQASLRSLWAMLGDTKINDNGRTP